MIKNIILCFLPTVLLLTLSPAEGQQPKKIYRIGYVAGEVGGNLVGVFRQGLRDLGYVEGKDILLEYRSAEGHPERIPSLVNELLKLKLDVLVLPNAVAIRSAKEATKTVPIVMLITMDPIATGIIDSLAQPEETLRGLPDSLEI